MSNWEIEQQETTVGKGDAKETIMVDCKSIDWRPSSPKELNAGSGKFKKLGTPTFRILYRHKQYGETHKVVAQHVKMKRKGKVIDVDGNPAKTIKRTIETKKGDKVVTEYVNPAYEWRVNLHFPDRVKPKQLMTRQRVTCVSIDDPSGETTVEKSNTGTHPYESFFSRKLPEFLRDAAFRITIQGLLNEAISDREQALADAA